MKSRKEIFDEIQGMLGRVPSWMMGLPDAVLESDWSIFKVMEIQNTNFPAAQKHLIGAAVAAACSCPEMAYWHGRMAMAMGATDTEVDEAIRVAKYVSGWSTAIEGLNLSKNTFMTETEQVVAHIRQSKEKAA